MVINGYTEVLLEQLGQGSPMHHQVAVDPAGRDRAATSLAQLLAFSRKQLLELESGRCQHCHWRHGTSSASR